MTVWLLQAHFAPSIPLAVLALLIYIILMTNKITLGVGPFQMTLYKPRKRRKRASRPRRRTRRS